jgi:hypothetical protein
MYGNVSINTLFLGVKEGDCNKKSIEVEVKDFVTLRHGVGISLLPSLLFYFLTCKSEE